MKSLAFVAALLAYTSLTPVSSASAEEAMTAAACQPLTGTNLEACCSAENWRDIIRQSDTSFCPPLSANDDSGRRGEELADGVRNVTPRTDGGNVAADVAVGDPVGIAVEDPAGVANVANDATDGADDVAGDVADDVADAADVANDSTDGADDVADVADVADHTDDGYMDNDDTTRSNGNPGKGNPGNAKSVGGAGEKGMDNENPSTGTRGKSN